ncbi:DUF4260 domain-containing protein [Marinoscillum furvescens]|uniref:Uncharacterized protein DUF4260 n=1 Tax=Marinoscillum furvescens DSM 4134 TaxID=1122208 RepID=A0A3D9L546_MARFU|nr:DUF4260 domain-containing protein [Marinoscillum furvescens]REE00070.1 uncharacterized protein DUF4260 [Marinoscillum furvescens DSM 4134]
MNQLLKLEELGIFVLAIVGFNILPYTWWYFPALLLLPDIGMLGYLAGSRVGAICYNFFHHRLLASTLLLAGWYFQMDQLYLAGIILIAHISLDRMLGYGLKFSDSFAHTHLGWLKNTASEHDQK